MPMLLAQFHKNEQLAVILVFSIAAAVMYF